MIDYAIIIPTFNAHFDYVEQFLYTYSTFVSDKNKISVCIVLGDNDEYLEFNNRLKKVAFDYTALNIKIYCFDDILHHYNIHLSSKELLNKLGKFSYQTIKKLYAVHYLQYSKNLILDSESIIIKNIELEKIFDKYFSKPYVFYSDISYKDKNFKKFLDFKVLRNTCEFFGIECNNLWFFEAFHWFYDIRIINDLFNYCNNNLYGKIELLISHKYDEREKAIFDCTIYYLFIYLNNDKYSYNFVNILDEYKQLLSAKDYKKLQKVSFVSPIFMSGWHRMRYNLINVTAKIYKKYSLQISRPYIGAFVKNFVPLYKFINDSNISIITATNRVSDMLKLVNLNMFDKFIFNMLAYFRKIFNMKNGVASLCNKVIFIFIDKNNLYKEFEVHNLIEKFIPLGFADIYFVYEDENLSMKKRCAYKKLFLDKLANLSDDKIENLRLIYHKKYEDMLFVDENKDVSSQFLDIQNFVRKGL